MFRRIVLDVVLAAVAVSVVSVPPASAATTAEAATTAFTLDRMWRGSYPYYVTTRTSQTQSQAAYTDVTVTAATAANGVRLLDAGGTHVTLAPPAGAQFVTGTSFPLSWGQSATAGVFAPTFCDNEGAPSGQATVTEAVYADGVLTSLAAEVHVSCSYYPAGINVRSAIRIANDTPYSLVRSRVAGADPRAAAGGSAPFTVRVDNLGTAPATVGTPVLGVDTEGSYAVTSDGCAGQVLAPGAGCDVALAFTPGSFAGDGWHGGQLVVPVEGYARTPGVTTRLGGRAVPPPALPRRIDVAHGTDGVIVFADWHSFTAGGTTSYELVRRADAESAWTVLATPQVTAAYGVIAHEDTTIAPGASAEYAVRALGPLGESAYSAPRAMTRPAVPHPIGDVNAIVLESEDPATAVVLDAADGAVPTTGVGRVALNSPSDGSASVEVPLVSGPGVYEIPTPTHWVGRGAYCTASGTLTVANAVYDVAMRPVTYAAEFTGVCEGKPLSYSVRYRSNAPYKGVDVTRPAGRWVALSGTSADRTFTLRSAGTAPVTLGEATLAGTHAGEYQVLANGCAGTTLARGESCAVSVRATPGATGVRAASLRVATDTVHGVRAVVLDAGGAQVPSAPNQLQAYRVVGRVRLWWAPPHLDGGAPLTGYRVYRATPGSPWTFLADVPLGERGAYLSYEDPTPTPGVAYQYGIAAVNDVGESAKLAHSPYTTPRSEVLFTSGADDAPWGLYAQNERSMWDHRQSARFTVVEDGTDHYTPAVSPDGRTMVYSAPSANGYGLWVRPFGTGTPRLLTSMAGHEVEPAWSPDGRTIAFTSVPVTGKRSVWAVPAAGGTPVRRAADAGDPSWQPDSETLVAIDLTTTLRLVRVAPNGTKTVIPGTGNGRDPAVSPDGKWLAFSRWNMEAWQLTVLPIAGGSTPRYIQSNVDYLEPSWRRDARLIYYTSVGHHGSQVSGVGWADTGGFGNWVGVTDVGLESGGVQRLLGLHLTSAPHVTGPSAQIGFAITVPLPGEATTCSLDGAAPVACASPWKRSGLASGTHTLTIRSKVAGQPDTLAVHTWRVDATPPAVSFGAPASSVTMRDAVAAAYRASGAVSYDVRYRTAPAAGGYTAFAYPAAWQRTTATTVSLPARPGTEVCFSVRARDSFGNTSAWTPDRCSAVPYDDRHLVASGGWARAGSAGAFLGTLTTTKVRGASLTRTGVTGARVVVAVQRCTGCGAVDVSIGSVYLGRVSTHGTGADRVLLALPPRASAVAGTLRLTAVSTAPVRIDGVAVLRR